MDNNENNETNAKSFFNHLVVPIVTALIVGGTAPWWLEFIKGDGTLSNEGNSLPANSSVKSQNSEVNNDNSSIEIQGSDNVLSNSSTVAKDDSTVIGSNSTVTGENSTIVRDQSTLQQIYGSGSNISAGGDVNYNEAPDSIETVQDSIALILKKGMPYEEGRKILIDKGWQPIFPSYLGAFPDLDDPTIKHIFEGRGYQEVEACSGTGMGFCLFRFHSGADKELSITTVNNQPGSEITVWSWSFN